MEKRKAAPADRGGSLELPASPLEKAAPSNLAVQEGLLQAGGIGRVGVEPDASELVGFEKPEWGIGSDASELVGFKKPEWGTD